MTKINNTVIYVYDTNISDNDFVIGSDADTTKKQTKNYRVSDFRNYLLSGLSPEIGGTQKISEIIYNGELYSTPSAVANALNPSIQIQRYEDCIVNIKGDRYRLKLQNVSIGVLQNPINDTDFIVLSKSASLGNGIKVFKGYNPESQSHEFKTLVSDSIQITNETFEGEETGNIRIELVQTTDIPRFIVNSAYEGEEETGSPTKPFKTLQGAKTAFIGSGTASSPQFMGAEIIVEKGVGYNYAGNFSCNGVTLILEEGTFIESDPSDSEWFCDMDILADSTMNINFILKEGSVLNLNKSGFKNSGTTASTNNYSISKILSVYGNGTIFQNSVSVSANSYKIIESNFTTANTFNNDGYEQFRIRNTTLQTNTQSVYRIGGNSRIIFDDADILILGATGLPASTIFFNQIGGSVRKSAGSINVIPNFNINIDALFPLTKSAVIPCSLAISNTKLLNKMTTLFENRGSLQSNVQATFLNTELFTCVNIAKSPTVMWANCLLFNNVFVDGDVDQTQVDLTGGNAISTYNIFNSNVVESLRRFNNRTSASTAGVAKGGKFINTGGVTSPTTGWIIDIVM